jgi:phosphoglycerol transferase MdoB-like AlkP superfamily enzyme
VSGWGAYTIRAEFAALTGLDQAALGFDRWNPYHAFARAPMPSLARRLRDEGYRTMCLHPFDPTYYGRDKIMAGLGFDEFWGEKHFAGGERCGPYIADAEVARRASAILRDDGRGLFLFVITMENHGPWLADDPRRALPDPAPALPQVPGRDELRCFLHGLKHTDAMLGAICDTLGDGRGGLVAAYGDHLPSLPATYDALGFADSATDYAIWDARGGAGSRRDLVAHELPAAILAARAGLR